VNPRDDRDHDPARSGVELHPGQLTTAGASYRLRPSLEVFQASSGDLHLLQPGEAEDLVIRGATAADVALVHALQGDGAELGRLRDRTRLGAGALQAKLDALARAGALIAETGPVPALPAGLAERFERQLPYLAETGDPRAAQLRLREANVVVLGCGCLGNWALGALACTGIGHFTLVDDDDVELSNLNRQVLYGPADVGASKVSAARAWLHRFDPAVEVRAVRRRVRGPEDLADVLEGADALVHAADWPPYSLLRWVDEACRSSAVPFIIGGQRPPMLKIGPTFIPGRTACATCQEIATRRAFPLFEELAARRDAEPSRSITLGPASGIAGTLMALEVFHLVLGRRVPTEGRSLLLDTRTLETRWEDVERLSDCPACHHLGNGTEGPGS
jgi:bacteriocin biosynthesis cyclodehydratase domain-containing protein